VPRPLARTQPADADTEAAHLRRLLEKQPSCFMRVGLDGLLLAANDVALGLLGAEDHGQVLGSLLTTWIVPEHQQRWREFANTLKGGAPGSCECDLKNLAGQPRTVVFHAVPLLDHRDGIPSMMLTARDISTTRQLEVALQDHNPSGANPVDAEQLAQAQRALDAHQQLERLLKEGKKHLVDLRGKLSAAIAERDRLQSLLDERAAAPAQAEGTDQRLADLKEKLDTAVAARVVFERQLAEQTDAAIARQRESQQRVDEIRSQLEAAVAVRAVLEQQVTEQTERARSREQELNEQLSALRSDLDSASAERTELERKLADQSALALAERQEAQQRLDELSKEMQLVVAERDRLEATLEERAISHRARVEELEQQLARNAEAREQLERHLGESRAAHQRLETEGAERKAAFEQELALSAAKQKELAKGLADRRVEARGMEEMLKQLAPLAATGRAAWQVAHELSTVLQQIDANAAQLLERSTLEEGGRPTIEGLRADAIRARLLVGEIAQLDGSAATAPFSSDVVPDSDNVTFSGGDA
jgi:hypothetical protein